MLKCSKWSNERVFIEVWWSSFVNIFEFIIVSFFSRIAENLNYSKWTVTDDYECVTYYFLFLICCKDSLLRIIVCDSILCNYNSQRPEQTGCKNKTIYINEILSWTERMKMFLRNKGQQRFRSAAQHVHLKNLGLVTIQNSELSGLFAHYLSLQINYKTFCWPVHCYNLLSIWRDYWSGKYSYNLLLLGSAYWSFNTTSNIAIGIY